MMNNARLNVGLLGLGTAERAWQQALAYAKERTQGRDAVTGDQNVPIIRHPDVRRMLMTMKAQTEAMRALAYYTSAQMDLSKKLEDGDARKVHQAKLDLLIPIVKAWCTDIGCSVADTGVQIHGGMGFIEETGAAQHMRDARIHPIYEGTNGIQAADLIGRKVLRDGGETMKRFTAEMRESVASDHGDSDPDLQAIKAALAASLDALDHATDWVLSNGKADVAQALSSSVPYLTLFGNITAGWLMARAAVAALAGRENANGNADFLYAKVKTARFFSDHYLTRSVGLAATITEGSGTIMALNEEQF
jgi:3-(methylsulfanyl)propanoyl-CoA dehydrogenase